MLHFLRMNTRRHYFKKRKGNRGSRLKKQQELQRKQRMTYLSKLMNKNSWRRISCWSKIQPENNHGSIKEIDRCLAAQRSRKYAVCKGCTVDVFGKLSNAAKQLADIKLQKEKLQEKLHNQQETAKKAEGSTATVSAPPVKRSKLQ